MIREINNGDYGQLMELYLHLHETDISDYEAASGTWEKILADENYHIIVAEEDGKIVSSCTVVVVPNLTRGVRPYARVEKSLLTRITEVKVLRPPALTAQGRSPSGRAATISPC